jgi:tagatose 6-phosphate kinase
LTGLCDFVIFSVSEEVFLLILTVTPNPCVDKSVFVDEISLGEFNRASRYSCVAGGKGCNVSKAVKTMGGDTRALIVVGGHTGRHVLEMMERDEGVTCLPVWVASPTRTITTVLEEAHHRQTAFFEPGSRVTDAEGMAIVEAFRGAVGEASVVCLSGTVSDSAIAWLYSELIPIARGAGASVILDSHGIEFERAIGCKPYMVKPNLEEAEEVLGTRVSGDASQWDAVDAFHGMGIEQVILSMGMDGALVSNGGTRFRVIPPKVEEVNPVGSGDVFVAGFALGLERGEPLEETAIRACAMGAANASSWDIGHFDPALVGTLEKQVKIEGD